VQTATSRLILKTHGIQMISKLQYKPNFFIKLASILNIIGLILVLLSSVHLTPLTLIYSLTIGGPLIFISLIIYILVVIIDEGRRRITE
jgi:hypothetical protein